MVASTVVCLVGWSVCERSAGLQEYDEHDTGVAMTRWPSPATRSSVFGGRADLQLESGLPSPYAYLWSLPMRTLDPDLAEFEALVSGPDAPTWIVEWVAVRHLDAGGRPLEQLVQERYVEHGTACGGRTDLAAARTSTGAAPTRTATARSNRSALTRPDSSGGSASWSERRVSGRGRGRGRPPAGSSSSGFSTTRVSVVSSMPAIEAALTSAERVTLTGSRTPWATRSPYSPVAAL